MNTIEKIAHDIDTGLDTADQSLIKITLKEIDRLIEEEKSGNPLLHYYRANAYAALRQFDPNFKENQFLWQQPEISEEILSLRRATKCAEFRDLPDIRKCQIFTNLGNNLNTTGRSIKAMAAWDQALEIEPNFAMAAANRASCR